jgi:hypothetical protein
MDPLLTEFGKDAPKLVTFVLGPSLAGDVRLPFGVGDCRRFSKIGGTGNTSPDDGLEQVIVPGEDTFLGPPYSCAECTAFARNSRRARKCDTLQLGQYANRQKSKTTQSAR